MLEWSFEHLHHVVLTNNVNSLSAMSISVTGTSSRIALLAESNRFTLLNWSYNFQFSTIATDKFLGAISNWFLVLVFSVSWLCLHIFTIPQLLPNYSFIFTIDELRHSTITWLQPTESFLAMNRSYLVNRPSQEHTPTYWRQFTHRLLWRL